MTVAELITALQSLPPSAPVMYVNSDAIKGDWFEVVGGAALSLPGEKRRWAVDHEPDVPFVELHT